VRPRERCRNCQHPKASHQNANGKDTKCAGSGCTCGGFEGQG
jgi:hypothetical protein